MFYLWQGLSTLIVKEDAEILFGSPSFKGTNISALVQPLSLLHEEYLTVINLRPKVLPQAYVSLNQLEKSQIERLTALKAMPALIKAYLRLGGGVADGAFIDQNFNTTDVCMVLDIEKMSSRQKSIYFRKLK
jgi:putative hemolysin